MRKKFFTTIQKNYLQQAEYGAGSENIHLINEDSPKKESIIQEYHPGVKGSFSM